MYALVERQDDCDESIIPKSLSHASGRMKSVDHRSTSIHGIQVISISCLI